MPFTQHLLVVANLTADSPELLNVLRARAEARPTTVYLVVPASPSDGREKATAVLRSALDQFRSAGLEADGVVGADDPFVAVCEAWDPRRYDEVIVSTLPMRVSKWLHAGLPERIGRTTGALVTHVVSQPAHDGPKGHPPPAHENLGVLTPLAVLGWGGQSVQKQRGRA